MAAAQTHAGSDNVVDALKQLDGIMAEQPEYTKFLDPAGRTCIGPER